MKRYIQVVGVFSHPTAVSFATICAAAAFDDCSGNVRWETRKAQQVAERKVRELASKKNLSDRLIAIAPGPCNNKEAGKIVDQLLSGKLARLGTVRDFYLRRANETLARDHALACPVCRIKLESQNQKSRRPPAPASVPAKPFLVRTPKASVTRRPSV